MKYHILLDGVLVGDADTLQDAQAFVKSAVDCNPHLRPFDLTIKRVK